MSLELAPSYPILAASKLSIETLVMLGVAGVLMLTMITFSNWRFGVKSAFVILLFEGAIRKWVFPQGQELVYFLKDMFLVGSYLRFFGSPDSEIRAWNIIAPKGFVVLTCALVGFSALNPNIGSVILALYGLKIYLYYIPLAFMIPYLFRTQEEMFNNLFWYAMMATPICLLGVAQFAAPGYSFLNVYAATGLGVDAIGFGFGEKVRITGTFSFITGHTTFVIVFTTLHIALLFNKQPKWRFIALVSNLPLLVANAFMGGSRGSIVTIGVVVIGFLVVSMATKVGTGGNIILVLGGVMAVIGLVVYSFFTEAKDQWMTRLRSTNDSFYDRIIGMQVHSLEQGIREGGMFGYGIGMTHPALERLRGVLKIKRPREVPPVFDSEMGQVMAEVGVVGFVAWYLMRVMLLVGAFNAFLRCPDGPIKPIILAAVFIMGGHMILSVVLNHTANFLVFAFYGITLIPSLHPANRSRLPGGMPSGPFMGTRKDTQPKPRVVAAPHGRWRQ